ncbi:MAG TPA: dienelactone hydrolase family protein [Terriglobales bacterium]|nr:dienelactone hydrolase family protein [Terriglobales bacterium]
MARQVDPRDAIKDIAAALAYLHQQHQQKCGVIGYCIGGLLAWLSATRLDPDAVVGYYGGRTAQFANETPRCPVMLHFGTLDKHIPKSDVDQIQAKHPEVEIFWYEADHGFNCNDRAAYNEPAARQARARSLEFLMRHLGK